MKSVFITVSVLLVSIAYSQNKKTSKMENNKIIASVSDVFSGADERNWEKVRSAMADTVLLDYTSLAGNPAALLPSNEIIYSWKNFLPGFDKTHHQLSGFDVKENGERSTVRFRGNANHFIGNEVWTVQGNYEADLEKIKGNWLVTMLRFNLEKQGGNTSLPALAVEKMKSAVITKKVVFKSDGLTLAGVFYFPSNFDESKKYSVVITDGSWTTVKEQMQTNYAKALAERGYVTFTFDHRYFGESEGQPREYENHEAKVEDIKNAVTYLQSLAFVDNDKIAALGVCASGAYMMQAASEDKRIKALATVVAWLMTPETAKLFYGGDEGISARITKAENAKKKFEQIGVAEYVPAYNPDNMDAAMFFPVDYYAKTERGALPEWKNNFAVMSWKPWLTYDGIASSKEINIPVVMVASEKQFLPGGTKEAYGNFNNANKEIVWLNNYEHTDFYDGEKAVKEAVNIISKAFDKYLNVKKNVLLVGKLLKNIPDTSKIEAKNINLFSASTLAEIEQVFSKNKIDIAIIGAGIEPEERIKMIRFIWTANHSTTIHLKDKESGPESFLPFINHVLNGFTKMKDNQSLISEHTVTIQAPVAKVWSVITNSETVEQFMLGMKPQTSWQLSAAMNWMGRHEGKEKDMAKGSITHLIPEALLEYTFFYGGYGYADIPGNYQTVRFALNKINENSTLINISQGDYAVFKDGATYLQHANDFWQKSIQKLKDICENK